MKISNNLNIADVLVDPTAFFSHPNEVIHVDGVPVRDKLAILESWELLEEQRLKTDDGGAADGKRNRLAEVQHAIEAVNAKQSDGR